MRRLFTIAVALLLLTAGAVPAVTASPATAVQSGDESAVSNQSGKALDSDGQTAAENNTTLTVLSYNDVQTAFVKPDKAGRLAALVQQRRQAHDNPTVLVGGGDELGPHALSPVSQWRVPVAVLNELQPTAEAAGNHDFDYGVDGFRNASNASNFPWLLANLVNESGETVPGSKPYTVVEKSGVRVGIVGLTNQQLNSKVGVDFNERGYEVTPPVPQAREYARQLTQEENADVVVVAGQLGVSTAKKIARNTEQVDVVVTGDDEVKLPPTAVNGTVVTEAQARANYLSEVNLTVSGGEVVSWNGRLVANTENVSVASSVANMVQERRNASLDTVVGTTEVALDARFSPNYHDETALGNMITDAFRWETGAQAAITNAGGIRSNSVYGPGNVTAGDVYNVLPFQNTLVTVELNGSEIKQLLASQVVTLESETGQKYGAEAQLQVSGVTYEWVGHENASQKIRDVRVNGRPIDEQATYTVTVNSYMAGWEGSVLTNATVVNRTNVLYGTALVEYIKAHGTVSPEDSNRIRRIDTELGTEQVTLDREGTVEASFDLPESVESVNTSTVRATAATNGTVAPESVTASNGTLTVTFQDSSLYGLAEHGGNVQMYAAYEDTRYNRSYFNQSVLNAELSPELAATTTATTTATQTSTATDTTTRAGGTGMTDGGSSSQVPGFGPAVTLVALLAAALLARRRD